MSVLDRDPTSSHTTCHCARAQPQGRSNARCHADQLQNDALNAAWKLSASMIGKSNSSSLTISFNLRLVVASSATTYSVTEGALLRSLLQLLLRSWLWCLRLGSGRRCAVCCFLPFVPCSLFSLSPPAIRSVSRASRAALVAARHTLRRSRAVCKCGPLSTRTHQASLHHVMCLFDTSFSSCIEFVSLLA